MPEFEYTVTQYWSENIIYGHSQNVKASSMKEAKEIAEKNNEGWSNPEWYDSTGDGTEEPYTEVMNLATSESEDFYD